MLKKNAQSMTQGPLLVNIISYTIPIILTSLLQLLFNAADLVVVGRFCGSICVAAVGATGSITNLIVNLFIGLSVGAGVTMAHALGAREAETVHRTVHTALPAALVSGAALTVVLIVLQVVLDVRIKDEHDLQQISQAPVLGVIPNFEAEPKAGYEYESKSSNGNKEVQK